MSSREELILTAATPSGASSIPLLEVYDHATLRAVIAGALPTAATSSATPDDDVDGNVQQRLDAMAVKEDDAAADGSHDSSTHGREVVFSLRAEGEALLVELDGFGDVVFLHALRDSILSGDFDAACTAALEKAPRNEERLAELVPHDPVEEEATNRRGSVAAKSSSSSSSSSGGGGGGDGGDGGTSSASSGGLLRGFFNRRNNTSSARQKAPRTSPRLAARRPPIRISVVAQKTHFAERYEANVRAIETLTPHQSAALAEAGTHEHVLLEAPAGGGKTFVALALILQRLLPPSSKGGGDDDDDDDEADGVDVDDDGGSSVVFASWSESLCLFVCRWICRRVTSRAARKKALSRLYLLHAPMEAGLRAVRLGRTPAGDRRIVSRLVECPKAPIGLLVVDESHHVYANADLRHAVESFVTPGATRRLLLADLSQSNGAGAIPFPRDAYRVSLTEVVRCSKRIIAGAMAFQTGGEQKLLTRCHHEATGPPLKSFLFDVDLDEHGTSVECYAHHVCEAIRHLHEHYKGLSLHDRLAILGPDGEFAESLRGPLERLLSERFSERRFALLSATEASATVDVAAAIEGGEEEEEEEEEEEMVEEGEGEEGEAGGRVEGQGNGGPPRECLVLDAIDQFDGLERLVIIAVGLDQPIGDSAGGSSDDGSDGGAASAASADQRTRSMLYRAVTRAHMQVIVVNEMLSGGWLEFLGNVRLRDDEKFSAERAIDRCEAAAVEAIVTSEVDAKLRDGAKAANVPLDAAALAVLRADATRATEAGEALESAVRAVLRQWASEVKSVAAAVERAALYLRVPLHAPTIAAAVRSGDDGGGGGDGDAGGRDAGAAAGADGSEGALLDELTLAVAVALRKGEAAQLDAAAESAVRAHQQKQRHTQIDAKILAYAEEEAAAAAARAAGAGAAEADAGRVIFEMSDVREDLSAMREVASDALKRGQTLADAAVAALNGWVDALSAVHEAFAVVSARHGMREALEQDPAKRRLLLGRVRTLMRDDKEPIARAVEKVLELQRAEDSRRQIREELEGMCGGGRGTGSGGGGGGGGVTSLLKMVAGAFHQSIKAPRRMVETVLNEPSVMEMLVETLSVRNAFAYPPRLRHPLEHGVLESWCQLLARACALLAELAEEMDVDLSAEGGEAGGGKAGGADALILSMAITISMARWRACFRLGTDLAKAVVTAYGPGPQSLDTVLIRGEEAGEGGEVQGEMEEDQADEGDGGEEEEEEEAQEDGVDEAMAEAAPPQQPEEEEEMMEADEEQGQEEEAQGEGVEEEEGVPAQGVHDPVLFAAAARSHLERAAARNQLADANVPPSLGSLAADALAEHEREALLHGERAARIGAAIEAAAKAERLLLTDAATAVLKSRIAAALQRGEALEAATAAAVAQYHRQLVRRQVQQSTWDPSANSSRKVSGVLKFMPFKHKDAEYLEYDLLCLIFTHLPFASLGKCALVSKRWRSVATDPSWKPELVALAWGKAGLTGLPGARPCPRPTMLPFAMEQQVIQICCSDMATLALTSDGHVWHWGHGWSPGMSNRSEPSPVADLHDIQSVACTVPGYYHGRSREIGFSCAAVSRRGHLYTWGADHTGQLMQGAAMQTHLRRTYVDAPRRVSFASYNDSAITKIERVLAVACGRNFIAIHTVDESGDPVQSGQVFTKGSFCSEYPHPLRSWAALSGLPLRQLCAGAFHCCCVTSSGELYTWGHPWGQDHANGNLLAQGDPMEMAHDATPDDPDVSGVSGLEVGSHSYHQNGGTRLPRRVTKHLAGEGPMGAVAEVACSTYSTMVVTVDGRAYSWGDCDGDSLGHGVTDCHVPARLTSFSGLKVAHGALCYTNGAAALADGQVYVWGGGMWQGGIGGGSEGPQRVGFGGGVPPCYRCSSLALGSWHGYLILRRLP